jgi:hypothetical protein
MSGVGGMDPTWSDPGFSMSEEGNPLSPTEARDLQDFTNLVTGNPNELTNNTVKDLLGPPEDISHEEWLRASESYGHADAVDRLGATEKQTFAAEGTFSDALQTAAGLRIQDFDVAFQLRATAAAQGDEYATAWLRGASQAGLEAATTTLTEIECAGAVVEDFGAVIAMALL